MIATADTVIELIEAHFEATDVDADTNLINELGMDSLELLNIVVKIENKLHISINDDAFEPAPVTVGDLVKIVERVTA